MRIATRLRTLEQRAGARERAKASCSVCGGQGRYNAWTVNADGSDPDEPLEPCPECGEVKLVRIIVPVVERITGPPMVTIGRKP